MGMQVNTNIAANNAYRNLATTQNDLSKSLEKLSSGLRINRAADDAAGLAISEGLKSQVGGLTVAARNAQDAISVIQTAEGSLNEVTSILQRMRDLAVQAGNDSNSAESRTAIGTEVNALRDELTRISESTNFNGRQLLDGTEPTLSFQIGANKEGSSQIIVNLASADVSAVVDGLAGDAELTTFSVTAATFKGAQTFSETHADGSTTSITTAAIAVNAAATDANIVTSLNNDTQFSNHFVAKVGAAGKIVVEALSGNVVKTANSTTTASEGLSGGVGTTIVGTGLDFTTAALASDAIETINTQITTVSGARAQLGADQNRFESVIKNLAVSKENLTAAGSRIRDTDMAEEMVKYTRANILSQAGTAMLAQANQSNSGVLQLLQ